MQLFIILSLLLGFNVPTENNDTTKEGVASWYGPGFNGRKTANGEIFCQDSLTAASPSLPFNTILEVTNIENNQSVIVRINDRGPFKMNSKGKLVYPLEPHPTRILDLSKAAFHTINGERSGLIKIKYKIIG